MRQTLQGEVLCSAPAGAPLLMITSWLGDPRIHYNTENNLKVNRPLDIEMAADM